MTMIEEKTWDLNNGSKLWHRVTLFSHGIHDGYVNFAIRDKFVMWYEEEEREIYFHTMTGGSLLNMKLEIGRDNCIWGEYSYGESTDYLESSRLFYPILEKGKWMADIKKARTWFINTAVRLVTRFFKNTYVYDYPSTVDTKTKFRELRSYIKQLLEEGGFKE